MAVRVRFSRQCSVCVSAASKHVSDVRQVGNEAKCRVLGARLRWAEAGVVWWSWWWWSGAVLLSSWRGRGKMCSHIMMAGKRTPRASSGGPEGVAAQRSAAQRSGASASGDRQDEGIGCLLRVLGTRASGRDMAMLRSVVVDVGCGT